MSACAALHAGFASLPRYSVPYEEAQIPPDGIYAVFERGERAHGGDRIVRIGTHTGSRQLRSRLRQHFLQENKDRSIFRKNIGRALLNRAGDSFADTWEIDLTPRAARERYAANIDLGRQKEIEREVTAYMREAFSFAVIPVIDASQRLKLEARIITTLHACPQCRPSPEWLGSWSPKEKIRQSGLWLVNGLADTPLQASEIRDVFRLLISRDE